MSGAHRCRTCRQAHYGAETFIAYPPPETLAALEPLILPLLEAAREFSSYGPGTPTEFVQWLSIDTARAAEMAVKLAGRAAPFSTPPVGEREEAQQIASPSAMTPQEGVA